MGQLDASLDSNSVLVSGMSPNDALNVRCSAKPSSDNDLSSSSCLEQEKASSITNAARRNLVYFIVMWLLVN